MRGVITLYKSEMGTAVGDAEDEIDPDDVADPELEGDCDADCECVAEDVEASDVLVLAVAVMELDCVADGVSLAKDVVAINSSAIMRWRVSIN